MLSEKECQLLRSYMTLPEGEDSALVISLSESAMAYMQNAGITLPAEGTPRRALYLSCLMPLVLDAYERRSVTITGTIVAANPQFEMIFNQLKLTDASFRF